MSELSIDEFYELNGQNMWGPLQKQMDPLTFYRFSTKSRFQSIRITCAKKEIEWLAKIIAEVLLIILYFKYVNEALAFLQDFQQNYVSIIW